LHDLGLKIGYPEQSARKSAWQFIPKIPRPPAVDAESVREGAGVAIKDLLQQKQ
jgi:hypothetical protein